MNTLFEIDIYKSIVLYFIHPKLTIPNLDLTSLEHPLLTIPNLVLTCFEHPILTIPNLGLTCFETVKSGILDIIPLYLEYLIYDRNLLIGLVGCILVIFVFTITSFMDEKPIQEAASKYISIDPYDPAGQLAKPKPSMIYNLDGTNQPLANHLADELDLRYIYKGSNLVSYIFPEPVKAFLIEHFAINDREKYDILFPNPKKAEAEAKWSKLSNTKSLREGLRALK